MGHRGDTVADLKTQVDIETTEDGETELECERGEETAPHTHEAAAG